MSDQVLKAFEGAFGVWTTNGRFKHKPTQHQLDGFRKGYSIAEQASAARIAQLETELAQSQQDHIGDSNKLVNKVVFDSESARQFLIESVLPKFSDSTFQKYVLEELAGDFAYQLAMYLASQAQQPTDLSKQLREYAADSGYSHNDYADTMLAAASEIERLTTSQAQQESKELGHPYGIVDPDYARIYTQSRIIAWQYGYSCLMHGSFTRDLDLLLVPWEESARDNHDQLLKLIADACGLQFKDGEKEIYKAKVDWTNKPHGRKSCSLFFKEARDRRWIDIAVLPVSPPAPEGDKRCVIF